MNLLRRIFFYLLLASIPIQLGKHFWPNDAFVNGIRVDYISPTLYLSDIFFVILFLLSFRQIIRVIVSSKIIIYTFAVLIIAGIFSSNQFQSFMGTLKFFEFLCLAIFCREYFRKQDIPNIIFIFTLGGIVESIILLFQFLTQSSIGGAFYYLGERTFSASTPGISLFSFGQSLILRPYGTFPHPNVASFYLLTGFGLLLFTLKFKKNLNEILKSAALLSLVIGLILTFSRVSIILVFVITLLRLLTLGKTVSKKKIFSMFWGSALFGGLIFLALFDRFESQLLRDLNFRFDLIKICYSIFVSYPIFGIGLNNFFFYEIVFQKEVTPILLQPVHNIYLYWIVQTGILGLVSLLALLIRVYRLFKTFIKYNIRKNSFYLSVFILVGSAFVIGIVDHYPLTLQQGQLLSAILIGLLFSKELRNFKI